MASFNTQDLTVLPYLFRCADALGPVWQNMHRHARALHAEEMGVEADISNLGESRGKLAEFRQALEGAARALRPRRVSPIDDAPVFFKNIVINILSNFATIMEQDSHRQWATWLGTITDVLRGPTSWENLLGLIDVVKIRVEQEEQAGALQHAAARERQIDLRRRSMQAFDDYSIARFTWTHLNTLRSRLLAGGMPPLSAPHASSPSSPSSPSRQSSASSGSPSRQSSASSGANSASTSSDVN